MPMQVVTDVLNQQTACITDLQQVTALQYILAQTLTVALKNHKDQEVILRSLQVMFAEKALATGITANSSDAVFDLAAGIFTSVKASL